MHDFTIETYHRLVSALGESGIVYTLIHDVDAHPSRSLRLAKIEASQGLTATYYFRAHQITEDAKTILAIRDLGHQIGYHYESLTTRSGNMEHAYLDFCQNLARLRVLAPVETACAHGSPTSRWNSQDIWNHYDIHALGIDYEPMLDTDFAHTLYLTDTGRRWDGFRVSVRDKVAAQHDQWEKEGLVFHSSDDIIHALNDMQHPVHSYALLVNTHPQRWVSHPAEWAYELVSQRVKNLIKRVLICFAS